MNRLTIAVGLCLLGQGAMTHAAGAAALEPKPAAACPSVTAQTFNPNVIRNFRIYTDPVTHESKVEQLPVSAKLTPLFRTGKILKEFNFGGAKRVQIVVAPADFDLPMHPAPYRESFIMLSGSVDMVVADGEKIAIGPGDMVTMDDMASKIGHGGRVGPCGYVDMEVVPE
jgi:mannose-6-phosphate isomerase-like protein (cupin superfamily)